VKARDLIFGIATLVVAILYYGVAATIPPSELADPVGPQGLPKTYAVLLAALSLLLIARSVRRPVSNPEPSSPESRIPSPASPLPRVTGMLLIGIAYILVLPWLGYFLSIAALITVTIYFQGGSINVRSILVALSGAALFWLLFIWLLRIQYPAGIWPSVI